TGWDRRRPCADCRRRRSPRPTAEQGRISAWQGHNTAMSDLSQLQIKSMRESVSREEWQTRVDLAACYRLVHHYGMDDLVYNHITARVPGPEHHFLINRYGLLFNEITASNLVKIDGEGQIVGGGDQSQVTYAGSVIHRPVH